MRSPNVGHIPALKQLVAMLARRSVGQGQKHAGWVGSKFARLASVTLVVLATLSLSATIAQAATGPVTISLTFDDTVANQYTLGYQRAAPPPPPPAPSTPGRSRSPARPR